MHFLITALHDLHEYIANVKLEMNSPPYKHNRACLQDEAFHLKIEQGRAGPRPDTAQPRSQANPIQLVTRNQKRMSLSNSEADKSPGQRLSLNRSKYCHNPPVDFSHSFFMDGLLPTEACRQNRALRKTHFHKSKMFCLRKNSAPRPARAYAPEGNDRAS